MTQPVPPPVPTTQSRTARHVLRTFIQVVIAEAAAIPSLASAFNISAGTTAKITGGVGAFVVLITALQNAGEDAGLIPTILENPVVKWVKQQVETGQPVVIPPTPGPAPVDPSNSNEASVRAPRKRAVKKTTAARKRTTATTRRKD